MPPSLRPRLRGGVTPRPLTVPATTQRWRYRIIRVTHTQLTPSCNHTRHQLHLPFSHPHISFHSSSHPLAQALPHATPASHTTEADATAPTPPEAPLPQPTAPAFPPPAVDSHSFASTLQLPQSTFTLHFNAALHEPRLASICTSALYQYQLHQPILQPSLTPSTSPPLFLLHDGPPFANGSLHIGHFLNKTLKDIHLRHALLTGHRVHHISGWDCHGLPIELKALTPSSPIPSPSSSQPSSSFPSPSPSSPSPPLPPLEIRRRARAFALAALEAQKAEFRQWGLLTDLSLSYRTLDPHYEAAQLEVFLAMQQRGLIYRALKPVHWSPATRTALAEAELEYHDDHVSPSVWVGFGVRGAMADRWKGLQLAVWTTTPWTLPGNVAVAYHPEVAYVVAQIGAATAPVTGKKAGSKAEGGVEGRYLLIGKDRVAAFSEVLGHELCVVEDVPTSALSGVEAQHPFLDRSSRLIPGLHVTTDAGTAFVHTAPAHGADDFAVCREQGISGVLSLVDEDGKFTAAAPAPLAGLYVLKEGNAAVVSLLRDSSSLLCLQPVTHRYPYDWRSKTPVITRATEQWFTQLDQLQADALRALDSVHFTPEAGRARLYGMLGGRKEWCLSRQRVWGVPIPVFYRDDGEVLMNEESVRWIIELVRKEGTDVWWEKSEAELLAPRYRADGHVYRKGQDTMDVWFDSGSSWRLGLQEAVQHTGCEVEQFDVYLEGSDQHRGWFQSSLLTAVAVTGKAPYKAIVTHGFVLDEEGRKMSKSLGNTIEPSAIIRGQPAASPSSRTSSTSTSPPAPQGKKAKKRGASSASSPTPALGADFLRLWVASTDYTMDASIGPSVLSKVGDVYRKVRGLARFMLGCLADWKAGDDSVAVHQLMGIDRYTLHTCRQLARAVDADYRAARYSRVYSALVHFINTDLSAFYFDISKDRLYADGKDSRRRRACLTVLSVVLETLTKAIAPILPHTAEDIYQHLPPHLQRRMNDSLGPDVPLAQLNSVFTHGWLSILSPNSALAQQMPEEGSVEGEYGRYEMTMRLRVEVNRLLELARHAKKREEVTGAEGDVERMVVQGSDTIGPSEAQVQLALGHDSRLQRALRALEDGELEMILGVARVFVLDIGEASADQVADGGEVTMVRVSGVVRVADADGKQEQVRVVVSPFPGVKCLRCWRYTESRRRDCLCTRCVRVLHEQGFPLAEA